MTFSSNTAQSRDMTELRNHLKWMDDERRKTAKKIAELEQRLAQQGREISEREQRIQELEWQQGQMLERIDRLPDQDAGATGQEQRLQDLEWHLSNINAQLVRLPKIDEELSRFRTEIDQSAADIEMRVSTSQSSAIEQMNEQATRNSESLHEMERDIADMAARMAVISSINSELADLQLKVDTIPAFDPTELRSKQDEIEQVFITRAAAQEEGFQAQLAAIEDRLTAAEGANQSLISAVEPVLQDRLTAAEARYQELLSAVEARSLEQLSAVEARNLEQLSAVEARSLEQLSGFNAENQELLSAVEAKGLEQLSAIDARVLEQLSEAEARNLEQLSAVDARVLEQLSEAEARNLERLSAIEVKNQEWLAAAEARNQERLAAAISDLRERVDAIPNFDAKLAAFQDEITAATTDYETRAAAIETESQMRLQAATTDYETRAAAIEADAQMRLQAFVDSAEFPVAVERIQKLEESLGGLPGIRESINRFSRLDQEMELRQAEEIRLANLLSVQEARIAPLALSLEESNQSLEELKNRFAETDLVISGLQNGITELNDELKPRLLDTQGRLAPLAERLAVVSTNMPKLEATLEAVRDDQVNMRDAMTSMGDELRNGQLDVTRQIESWQALQDEQKDTIERFTQQWLTLSNQYKEARMAVQNFAHWQKQLEQQKREASELVRVESNRLQSRWEGFLLEIQEKHKNSELDLSQKWQAFEMDNEQRWAAVHRTEQQWRDELAAVDELIMKLQQDNRNLIWRVQAAQADAIKKWPRLLLEEVEKAVELNPQRRLQPAAASTVRSDLSVIDALEQGLIKIDYEEDAGSEAA